MTTTNYERKLPLMRIYIPEAIDRFFPDTSFMSIYEEALANSFDAGADYVRIEIVKTENGLSINVIDNGEGFTDRNFNKFSSLMKKDDEFHKGLGRLIYLKYFKQVSVESLYALSSEGYGRRVFDFNIDFDGESNAENLNGSSPESNQTQLTFNDFVGEKLHKNSFVDPRHIKDYLKSRFFPMFFSRKKNSTPFRIEINLNSYEGFSVPSSESVLSVDDIEELTNVELTGMTVDLFTDLELHYKITEHDRSSSSAELLFGSDNRALPQKEILDMRDIPEGYDVFFLVLSSSLDQKTNSARTALQLSKEELKQLKSVLTKKVGEVLNDKIPEIKEKNTETKNKLDTSYPYLEGYFDLDTVGLLNKPQVLDDAERRFFKEQREVLEVEETMSDSTYSKSLELSSRVLMNYVLYRDKIIDRLSKLTSDDSEISIHNLILPRFQKYSGASNDSFANNLWIIDDKFSSYTSAYSEKTAKEVMKDLGHEDKLDDLDSQKGRPDIVILFSNSIEGEGKVDAVVVELKRLGEKIEDNETAISQLRTRASTLFKIHPTKLQRIWFYAIVDIDRAFRRRLKEDKFIELYSKGETYYNHYPVIADDKEGEEHSARLELFVISYKALIQDAKARNSSFLNLLKTEIGKSISKD